jgi:hypothetical protein
VSEQSDNQGVSDSVEVEVKGPDPNVWGSDEERPQPASGPVGPGIGEIHNQGTPEEVKGPGPEWEANEEGEYVNR